jgi:hypothetical protein
MFIIFDNGWLSYGLLFFWTGAKLQNILKPKKYFNINCFIFYCSIAKKKTKRSNLLLCKYAFCYAFWFFYK